MNLYVHVLDKNEAHYYLAEKKIDAAELIKSKEAMIDKTVKLSFAGSLNNYEDAVKFLKEFKVFDYHLFTMPYDKTNKAGWHTIIDGRKDLKEAFKTNTAVFLGWYHFK